MTRKEALAALKVAGYHDDSKTWARTYTENRISYAAAKTAWMDGQAARQRGVPCHCYTCTRHKQASP